MIDIKNLVAVYEKQGPAGVAGLMMEDSHRLHFAGRVQVKERPRISKGRAFTPPATRKFEGEVEKWAEQEWKGNPLTHPIRVVIKVLEATSDAEKREHYYIRYNEKGDIDNLGKSILDGMNGIVYKDDKQISDLRIFREYAPSAGFYVFIQRSGLSPLEYRNFKARIK